MSTSKSKSKSKEEQKEEQQLPPSGRMNDLLGNYRALQEVLSSLSIESARALHAIGNDISLQQKIRERQYDIPIYIYKVDDDTIPDSLHYQCKSFRDLNEFKKFLEVCVRKFKRDFNITDSFSQDGVWVCGDKFVRVDDPYEPLVSKHTIYRLLPWEFGDNECEITDCP